MNRARHLTAAETGSDLETFCGGYAEHGVGEFCLQLVETGLAETSGCVLNYAGDCPPMLS